MLALSLIKIAFNFQTFKCMLNCVRKIFGQVGLNIVRDKPCGRVSFFSIIQPG